MVRITPSNAALDLLKEFEQGPTGSFSPVVYKCPAGYDTIGWGHRVKSDDKFLHPISEAEADNLLRDDLFVISSRVCMFTKVPLTQSMMDALVCFVYNVGISAFMGSTLLSCLNNRQYRKAADELLKWDKARNPKTGKKERLSGLTRRRKMERELFIQEGFYED